MKRALLAVTVAVTAAMGAAQAPAVTVEFQKVTDTVTAAPGGVAGDVRGNTYVPVSDRFIAARGIGTAIEVYKTDGSYDTNMSQAGITVGGLGFFGFTATEDGVIYGVNDSGKEVWRWNGVADPAPEHAGGGAETSRIGYTGKVGNDVVIAFTGQATDGNVVFFSDTFPFSTSSFAFNEKVDLDAKNSLAINNAGTVVFTQGDTSGRPISKWVKTDGVWGATPAWTVGSGASSPPAGPMAYDNVHDILFHLPTAVSGNANHNKLSAYSGATGDKLGETTVETAAKANGGRYGGSVTPTATGGTLYMSAQAPNDTSLVMYVYTYTVTNASVNDWALYEQ